MYPRLFMEYDLKLPPKPAAKTEDQRESKPNQIELTRWSTDHYQAAAELIHDCYIGHIDSRINDQYCSLHGSLRFLHNIVRFPGCGVFDPHASWVLRDRHTGALVGMFALLPRRQQRRSHHSTLHCTGASRDTASAKCSWPTASVISQVQASPQSPSRSLKRTSRPSSSTKNSASSSAIASTTMVLDKS